VGKGKLKDIEFMRRALRLAEKGKGLTNPNPLVGAVVVKKGKIVGQGYHRKAGLAHAEVLALDQAGRASKGACLYVNLEPCSHTGRTAPCVDKIKASGIKQVIFAMSDPNPLNNGKGSAVLRRHGIKVVSGVLEQEAREINQVFIKYISKKLPFVTVKVAQSLDGKIATKSGHSRWISSPATRKFAHQLREQVDAILVGINTVLLDNPLLSCRINARLCRKQPKKIILDSRLRTPERANIFSSRSPGPVLIATTRFAPRSKVLSWRKRGISVIMAKERHGRVDLKHLFKQLAGQEIAHILIEGGGEVVASALKQRLVDKMYVAVSPKIIGGRSAPTSIGGKGINRINQATELIDIRLIRSGPDLLIEGRPNNVYRGY
jgi:diaminohydroxyphosphoribosylaminopyrimidine deaminase/5-amino-6-(5-phosphoribosylamino)uracil reductase